MKKLYKVLLTVFLFIIAGCINSYAVTDDTEAPVFDPNIKTLYILQKSVGEPSINLKQLINDVKATDNIDGNNVSIFVDYDAVNLLQDGQYSMLCTATDQSGNVASMVIVVIVDGRAPIFEESTETVYYINKDRIIYNSNREIIESLPSTLIAKDSMGAFKGIGVYITDDEQGNIIFVDTMQNTPAQNIILPNDILLEVDGVSVKGKNSAYAATQIKEESTDSVLLKILRNGQEQTVTLNKDIIKIYEDEAIEAQPNIAVESINTDIPGTIEIKYIATDQAGNTAEFVITVIVIDESESDLYVTNKEINDAEEIYNITSSGNPPEGITVEILEETELDEVFDEEIIDEQPTEEQKELEETIVDEKEDTEIVTDEQAETTEIDETIEDSDNTVEEAE